MFASGKTAAVASAANYIEDVFSTYLYTGTGTTSRTITNNIDLSTKGGLVWIKDRSTAYNHMLCDTNRGISNVLISSSNDNQVAAGLSSVSTTGFVTNSTNAAYYGQNASGDNIVSWTFRKQPKFFDIVTYTGTGANRTISHNLGSAPGCIIVKRTDTTSNWQVYHNGLTSAAYSIQLNLTNAQASATTVWNSTAPTSTEFSVGTDATVNASGGTYVAYIYAHNAGGFGLTGTDNVISCGSFTTDGSGTFPDVTLGYEPQWILAKNITGTGNWILIDSMRGMPVTNNLANVLLPNLSNAESTGYGWSPRATGFGNQGGTFVTSSTYIYIAIRKGPMKVPTDATTVFIPIATTTTSNTTNFPVDATFYANRVGSVANFVSSSRLTGGSQFLTTSAITAEQSLGTPSDFASNTSVSATYFGGGTSLTLNAFRRAPKFFDQVCFTSTNSTNQRINHNLGVAPELIFTKARNLSSGWWTYISSLGRSKFMSLNNTLVPQIQTDAWGTSDPTATDFGMSTNYFLGAGINDVAYLFATCAGVSKVGSYTGTGALQTVNCGFTGGARFVLIKRTDSTGDWYVYDSARGISSGNDPYLLLNSSAAEVTGTNYVDTDTTGFKVTAAAPAGLNASGGTYIFLAIA